MVYTMLYIVYHMVYNLRHLIIIAFLLPPVRFFPLSSAPLHRLSCSLASFTQLLPSPSLSFFHSDFARLTSSVAQQAAHTETSSPHPASKRILAIIKTGHYHKAWRGAGAGRREPGPGRLGVDRATGTATTSPHVFRRYSTGGSGAGCGGSPSATSASQAGSGIPG